MKLIGTLTLAKAAVLQGELMSNAAVLQGNLSAVRDGFGGSSYTGDYVARSRINDDYLLPTAERYLQRDITVKKIPYYETSNLSDGLTVYIGEEIEING
ncbi:hypothetical protein [Phascolarctobacterium succinatutens]|jgi:hypothetical protein|uniref:hypothetical protein n=1 Tax=Phascolarctobacterium succinatutens TaxID=626940 RepID=UPI0025F694DB|nr:hypothetical protein [Phascolarctobacterium succinatutens]